MSRLPSSGTDVGTGARSAVVLLSGGLDSATALAVARRDGFTCHAVSFEYGQRHRHELEAARLVAHALGAVSHRVIPLDVAAFAGSALTSNVDVPKQRSLAEMSTGIPVTYVPARNLVFLSIALALAETLGALDLFIGVNAIDYSGYPDCRPEFVRSFEDTAALATKAGVEGRRTRVHAPLLSLSKPEIIKLGHSLGVDFGVTHSCYDPVTPGGGPDVFACGECDSCRLRRQGFRDAAVQDPTRYASPSVVTAGESR
jgi:7-cyano-7-deazaguanine synthase